MRKVGYKVFSYSISEQGEVRMKQKRPKSLRRRLLFLTAVCWIVPVLFIFLFITISYRNSIIEKTEMLMEEWVKNFTSLHAQKIDEAITISKKPSYELVIEKAWKRYKNGGISHADFYREVNGNLISKFYNDNRFVISVFYLSEAPERLYYTSRQPADYIQTYHETVESEANKITGMDTSDAHVRIIDNKLYIIRNFYTTTNYTKFGTLVLELNQDKLFGGISKDKDYEMGFFINSNDSMIYYDQSLGDDEKSHILQTLSARYSTNENWSMIKENDGLHTGLLYQQRFDDYHFGALLVANEDIIYSELNDVRNRIILILIIIVPVFIYMLYFITRHITKPIGRMIGASKELEKGNIGMQLEGDPMPNAEFTYLLQSFNRMSSEIKYIIDYAYNEELAKKEAKIIALQSQINPHFLNNTLEMMNWQARMAGDVEVTKMIEALGTLLDYSMDRSNKKLIHLSEELRCADAYLYIASMRFGQRLRIEKEIDDSLLDTLVPQLILQPIIENAVVHGVEVIKSGVIRLKVFREKDNVILKVINTGKNMTEEDIDRVQNILNSKNPVKEIGNKTHTSLGIRNVNERIKLIYGEEYGLTILPNGEGETASTITIPSEPMEIPEKDKLLKLFMEKID
ncbi:MAG: HAMP domain-containing protein [Anaerolineaceae bacterium]|nr:MAG: HAMP domain-containing protein [Anaerolineaceae bacterium]